MKKSAPPFVMVVLAFAVALLTGGCEPSTPTSQSTIVKLAPSDLKEAANLTGAEVDTFVGKCVADRKSIYANLAGDKAYIQKLASTIDQTFPTFCSCLASNLGRRMTKMQFLMAQAMVDSGSIISFPGSPMPAFDGIRAGAAVHGMSTLEFEAERQKFRKLASSSAESCFLCLSAPSGMKCWK